MPFHVRSAACAAALLVSFGASAGRVCRQLDIPGSSETQLWQINSAGQIAATSDVGGFIYSAGTWIRDPPTPPGYQAGTAQAIALNDSGEQGGYGIRADDGSEQAYYQSGGAFHFLSVGTADFPNTETRGINNAGILSLWVLDSNDFSGPGGIYNPGPSTLYPLGFTAFPTPTLPAGSTVVRVLPVNMNDAGRVVGSIRSDSGYFAFFHDPGGTTTVYQLGSLPTRAAGINNLGDIAGTIFPNAPDFSVSNGYVRSNGVDTIITCPEVIGASGFLFFESINDAGVVSGQFNDAEGNAHGLVVYPSAEAELDDLLSALEEEVGPGESLESKLRVAEADLASGNSAGACGALRAFAAETRAQSGKTLDPTLAGSLGGEAAALVKSLCGP